MLLHFGTDFETSRSLFLLKVAGCKKLVQIILNIQQKKFPVTFAVC